MPASHVVMLTDEKYEREQKTLVKLAQNQTHRVKVQLNACVMAEGFASMRAIAGRQRLFHSSL